MRTIYLALHQSIFQYGDGLTENALAITAKQIIRICLRKRELEGSTNLNFKILNVLSVKLLYIKISIM